MGVVRETRVAWFVARQSKEKRLAYMRQDYSGDFSVTGDIPTQPMLDHAAASWSGADGRGATSYGDAHVEGGTAFALEPFTEDDVFGGFVEPELVEPALKKHEETWRDAPRTHLVPDYVLGMMETWGPK